MREAIDGKRISGFSGYYLPKKKEPGARLGPRACLLRGSQKMPEFGFAVKAKK